MSTTVKSYKAMTVGDLIDWLKTRHPNAVIPGLSADADSYRGYYEHVSIEPGDYVYAGDLLAHLESQVGTTMTGYKGGEYKFDLGCYVFVARYGCTGPFLAGFDDLTPVVVEQGWF